MKWGMSFVVIYVMTVFLLIIQLMFVRPLKGGLFLFETLVLLVLLSAAFILVIGMSNQKRWSLLVANIFFLVLFFNNVYLFYLVKSTWLSSSAVLAFIGMALSGYMYLSMPKKKYEENSLEFLKDTLLSNMKKQKKIPSIRKKK